MSPRLDQARLRTLLLTIALSVATVTAVRDQPWSDGRVAETLNAVECAVVLWHIARYHDAGMARLMLFGLTLGAVELVADALCVAYTGTLDYAPARSTMLWASPWWMPFAWTLVAAQIGYLGVRLMDRLGQERGLAVTALLGAVNIPFYEEMAYHAHWWRYTHCKRLGHTPLYIIAAELIIGLLLGPLARVALQENCWGRAVGAGFVGGLGTIIGGLIGYGLVERIL